ncbi:MAG: urease accessory protein UreD [Acidimicrobiales bacterium]
MRARARVVAEPDGRGGTRLACMRSEAPLVLRSTPGALYLVGGAGGPLGGDDLLLEIVVGAGARLTVRTAAASVALPGPGPSWARVRATVVAGGELQWLPEPLVAAQGSVHHMEATVVLDDGARLVWREEVILGRHRETPGSVRSRVSVDHDGTALLRHELGLGPAHPHAASPAVAAGARAAGSVLLVGPGSSSWQPIVLGPTAAVLPLARSGFQVVALAADAPDLRRLLDEGMHAVTVAGV